MSIERFSSDVQNAFVTRERHVNGHADGPLHAARRNALEAYTRQGVPTTRHEEWKYTNLMPLMGLDFVPAEGPTEFAPASVPPLPGVDAWKIVMVNGIFDAASSMLPNGIEGLHVLPLTDELVAGNASVREKLNTTLPMDTHPFVALNTAIAHGGMVIKVDARTVVDRPLHVVVIGTSPSNNVLHTPRILVIAEAFSSLHVIESHHTVGTHAALGVAVTEIFGAEESHVTYTKLVDDVALGHHIGYTGVHLDKAATAVCTTSCTGGAFTRNDLAIRLLHPTAEGYLYGVSVLDGKEYADNHTVVDHTVPHCHSEELYKGIYNGSSTGVFNGKIYVRPQAQKTTAYQSNHTLLLSDGAQMNAKPQLEIWADDVKCSHGATSGQLDDEAIFYLRSRGLGIDDARALLTFAFAAEVTSHLEHEGLRTFIEERIQNKLESWRD